MFPLMSLSLIIIVQAYEIKNQKKDIFTKVLARHIKEVKDSSFSNEKNGSVSSKKEEENYLGPVSE